MCESWRVFVPYRKNIMRGHRRGIASTTAETIAPTTLSPHRIAYATQVKHASADFVLRWALLDWLRYGKQGQKEGFQKECKRTTLTETLNAISWCLLAFLVPSKNITRVRRRFSSYPTLKTPLFDLGEFCNPISARYMWTGE